MSLQCLEAGLCGRPLPKDTVHNSSRRAAPATPPSRLRLLSAYHQEASQAPRHLHDSAAPRRTSVELKGLCRSLATSASPEAALEQPGTDREQVGRSLPCRIRCDDILRPTLRPSLIRRITRSQKGGKGLQSREQCQCKAVLCAQGLNTCAGADICGHEVWRLLPSLSRAHSRSGQHHLQLPRALPLYCPLSNGEGDRLKAAMFSGACSSESTALPNYCAC